MESILVKDLMVPLSEYAVVSEEATLYDAIRALEKAQEGFSQKRYKHRAILVCDAKTNRVIGKLSQLDVLRSLEPKYDMLGQDKTLSNIGLSRFGLSTEFLRSLLKQYNLLSASIDETCKNAGKQNVKKFMYTLTQGEFVAETAAINEAIHQFVMGHHQSLLVTRGDDIVGILRLTDVFMKISEIMTKVFD
jgi:CBS domain-containing protein